MAKWTTMVKEYDEKKKKGQFSLVDYTHDKGQMLFFFYLTMLQVQKNEKKNWLTNSSVDDTVEDMFADAHSVYVQLDDIDEKRMLLEMLWCSILQKDEFVQVEQEWIEKV